ncbi:MAG: T9SS type A sorting domain-containing protein [Bacteroidota bacterium]|nr:T9SS type A sorting domain-containing protein [Bacteroidota bacterium]
MKKTLLFLTFAFLIAFASAQSTSGCIPDPQYSSPGIYPDTAIGLAPGYVGQNYIQNITIITPLDTSVEILPGQTVAVTIDSIVLTSVMGLPAGFDYACDPPTCQFIGGSTKCAELYSTIAPDASLIGVHDIIFETSSYASNVPFIGTYVQEDVIDYYYIEIFPATSTINQFNNTTFELKGVYPNPSVNQAKIQFVSGAPEEVVFKIYNLLGEEIESQLISSSRGVNTIYVNTSLYPEGVYLYSINNGKQLLTKRMVVQN